MKARQFTALLFFFVILSSLRGQSPFFSELELSSHLGFIWAHNENVGSISGRSHVFQIDGYRYHDGSKIWHHLYNVPRSGYSLVYTDFGNEKIGRSLAAMTFMEPYLIKKDKWFLTVRLGAGLVYVSNPYDSIENPGNGAIGSHMTYSLQARLALTYNLGEKWRFNIAPNLLHHSNGAYQMPNAGSNVPSISAGLTYRFHDPEKDGIKINPDTTFSQYKKWEVNAYVAGGVKELKPAGGEKFPVYVGHAFVSRRLSYKSALNMGLNLSYNTALEEILRRRRNEGRDVSNVNTVTRASITGGYELYLHDISFLITIGAYVMDELKYNKPIFQRYGLRWHLSDNLFLAGLLKVHYARADYVEFAAGIKF